MKKATLALALGLLIGSATTAIAATDTVQATIAKFKFVVNGEQQQLKNDPLVRNGVTYLPVRETAELLGAQVDFKDGTITLDAKDGGNVSETSTVEGLTVRELIDVLSSKYPELAASNEISVSEFGNLRIGTQEFDLNYQTKEGSHLRYFDISPLLDAGILDPGDYQ